MAQDTEHAITFSRAVAWKKFMHTLPHLTPTYAYGAAARAQRALPEDNLLTELAGQNLTEERTTEIHSVRPLQERYDNQSDLLKTLEQFYRTERQDDMFKRG